MTTRVSFEVLGTPAPKGSSRAMFNRKTGKPFTFKGGSPVTAVKLDTWDGVVRAGATNAVGSPQSPPFVRVALRIEVHFRICRRGGDWGSGKNAGKLKPSASRYPSGKPDIDKLARSTLDSMTGIVFDDDSRVVALILTKSWAVPGNEGATISVEAL